MSFENRRPAYCIHAAALIVAVVLPVAACTTPPQGEPPVLDSITFHKALLRYQVVYPEFNFHAADGNVVQLHRELLTTDKPGGIAAINPIARIDISPAQQQRGATFVGGWTCGPEQYSVTLRAYLIDANGNESNRLDYTIRCNDD